MKRNGFTLVELLAVIVILAIILAIAIPSITNVVNSSRLSSFAVSSKMLERAAKTYLSVNNISVASGTTSYILYNDMKSAGYINKVVDPQSNTECTHSGVYVTNNSGTYTYKGALVCDNYMDIDSYNIFTNSDFSNGTTGWSGSGVTLSASNSIMQYVGNGTSRWLLLSQTTPIAVANGKKIYMRSKQRVRNSACEVMYAEWYGTVDGYGGSIFSTTAPSQDTWYKSSNVFTLSSVTTGTVKINLVSRYVDAATTNGKVTEFDGTSGVYIFDLTAIYGAGNEPTVTQMDNIMTNMGK